MKWEFFVPAANQIQEIDATLRNWEGRGGIGCGFQIGDLGWMLRHGREETARDLLLWIDDHGRIGAIGVSEGSAGLWLQINPVLLLDQLHAETIAADVTAATIREVSCTGVPAAIRGALGRRGAAIDPAPWLHMWKQLTDDDLIETPGVVSTPTESLIVERVAVQRSAFGNSTFTHENWESMTNGPAFVPGLALVALDDERGVSALTAWLPRAGACGMIEPMGTYAEYRRQGHGRRVLRASFTELRRLGASGVRVFTQRENASAVATYLAVGFRVLGYDTTLVLTE